MAVNIRAKHLQEGDVTTEGIVREAGSAAVLATPEGATIVRDPDAAVTLIRRG